jgi:putative endonuclease
MTAVTRVKAYRRGRVSERVAALLLRCKGFRILARGYRTPVGEIDIVARRGRLVVFVEVKARESLASAAEGLRPAQRRRIARAAEAFLGEHTDLSALDTRFDVILLAPSRFPRHLRDAWRP